MNRRPPHPGALRPLLAPALLLALAIPLLALSLRAAPPLRVDVGAWGDGAYLTGAHDAESNPSESYRWTRERAELLLPRLHSGPLLLRLRAHGGRPPGLPAPRVVASVGGRPVGSFWPDNSLRVYELLLPDAGGASVAVALGSDVVTPPGDSRALGFAIDWVELAPLGAAGPATGQLAAQALLLALVLALLASLRLPRSLDLLGGAAALIVLLAANSWQPGWLAVALLAWVWVLGALLAATWLARGAFARWLAPWLAPRQADAAWALVVAALAIRLLGAAHPFFEIHDIGFHRPWLESVARGQLYIYSTPSEFQNRETFNPPIGYLLILPLYTLLPSTQLVLQVGTGLVDALGCLLLLPLARALRLAPRAALLALALYMAMPINTTMLWWGFITNDMAQTVGLLLTVLLLGLARAPGRARWLAFTAVAAAGLLMHIGALVLIVALLGASLLLGWLRLAPASRWSALGGAALALALTGLLYFSAVASPALAAGGAGPRDLSATLAEAQAALGTRFALSSKGWLVGFVPLALALAPLGYLLLLGRQPRGSFERTLLLTWLAVCALFYGVYMASGLLVRYIYFVAPLVCLALGALLSRIWPRCGRLVALAIVLLVASAGLALWAAGVLLHLKPTLVPLTH